MLQSLDVPGNQLWPNLQCWRRIQRESGQRLHSQILDNWCKARESNLWQHRLLDDRHPLDRYYFFIIIDTFADLRTKNNEIEEDSKMYCFIWDQTREDLGKQYGANGFEYHISEHHNLLDCLFFVLYLEVKGVPKGSRMNAIESYASIKYKNENNSWFPCEVI